MPNPASDREEIRNLLARYCLLLDHEDVEACVALFTEDGTFDVYGRTFGGHHELERMMRGAPGGLHLGGNPVIELVDAGRACTQQNLLFVDRSTGASRSAVYDDELVRTDDGWRFAARRCRFIVPEGLSDRPAG